MNRAYTMLRTANSGIYYNAEDRGHIQDYGSISADQNISMQDTSTPEYQLFKSGLLIVWYSAYWYADILICFCFYPASTPMVHVPVNVWFIRPCPLTRAYTGLWQHISGSEHPTHLIPNHTQCAIVYSVSVVQISLFFYSHKPLSRCQGTQHAGYQHTRISAF